MRCFLLFTVLLTLATVSYSQTTNKFPPDGSAGIGTLDPSAWFSGKVFEMKDVRPTLRLSPLNEGGLATILFKGGYDNTPATPDEFHLNYISSRTQPKIFLAAYQSSGIPILTILGNGNLGVGASNPVYRLDVYKESAGSGLNITGLALGTRNDTGIDFSAVNGAVVNYAKIGLQLSDGTAGTETGGLTFSTINRGSLTEKMFIDGAGNVAIGTTDAKGYKLAVAGSAIAESVTVKLKGSWPDYVFDNSYKLLPLTAVKAFIGRNHHLPDLPTAPQVVRDGVDLGERNK